MSSFHSTTAADKMEVSSPSLGSSSSLHEGQVATEGKARKAEDGFMHNKTEQHDRMAKKGRTVYSSTSSVYAEHTISDPNNDQVLYW